VGQTNATIVAQPWKYSRLDASNGRTTPLLPLLRLWLLVRSWQARCA
jgi:hypothetical protein